MGAVRESVLVKKVCVLGDPAVGKTSLVSRFVTRQFGEEYVSTIGASVCEKSVRVGDGPATPVVRLVLWDIAGQCQFTSVTPGFYRGAEGALLVCDLTRRETLRNLFQWDHRLRRTASPRAVLVLFNKSDLSAEWEVSREEAEAVAGRLGCPHLFTSARTGENVEEAFTELARNLARHRGP
ncbi:MAG: Rab family GTPase [Thermoplasmata archaeon]